MTSTKGIPYFVSYEDYDENMRLVCKGASFMALTLSEVEAGCLVGLNKFILNKIAEINPEGFKGTRVIAAFNPILP